jgi:hypothetical protein
MRSSLASVLPQCVSARLNNYDSLCGSFIITRGSIRPVVNLGWYYGDADGLTLLQLGRNLHVD